MNTPITTLTSVSALCEDYGQGMDETDDTSSLPRMQIDAFRAWLQRADPGACLEYHRGLLSLDRSPDSNLPEARRRALSRVADLALNAAERGRVHLVQRRNGELDFSYLAIKANRTPQARGAFAAPLARRHASTTPDAIAA
jgi:hypothetical protein